MKKLSLLAAAGVGYVLGARAGRARYEQIASGARRVAGNPKVQAAAGRAQETVAQQAPVVASAVKDKASAAASTVQEKVSDTLGRHEEHDDDAARTSTSANTSATSANTSAGQPYS
jgi:hypothetical protein